jgi:DNA-binding transcriptional LysR family regulator
MLGECLMPKLIQWERQIGRRLRLRDLFIFFTVAEHGSMAKAASKLGVSTPSISEAIANLEHSLRVRLLDRSRKGVVTTPYGETVLVRGRAAFDELRQGIKDIESIADPDAGELRIGCPEPLASGFLLPVMERLTSDYPRVKFHIQQTRQPSMELPELHERKVDLVLAPLLRDPAQGRLRDQLKTEVLFNDRFILVVGEKSKWARRRKLQLADLVNEPWIMPPLDALDAYFSTEGFTSAGISNFVITTLSHHVRMNLVSSGRFITAFPRSVLQVAGKRHALRELPIKLAVPPYPVAIVTLRNRTLSPAVRLFVERAREVAKSLNEQS